MVDFFKKIICSTKFYGVFLITLRGARIIYSFIYYFDGSRLFIEWELVSFNSIPVILTFLLDWIRLSFIGVVLIISSIVMIYSASYISSDKTLIRFIILVFLFVLSIILLILRPNIISILLGWDGLGLVSYCLVIYYQNVKSARAGLLTVLSNRIGDVAILLTISWMFNYGRWNFYYLQFIYRKEMVFIIVLIILAAITKSAQIPFSAWLPAAIAAPTPVSSLVHSSTLVTAGVYLLIRFHELIQLNSFLLLISVATIFISGVGANFEIDLKKIIALSTLSQLGVIIIILSIGIYELSYFHLVTHALFKSLLFLCAGVYIHRIGDIQDIRIIGGVGKILPLTRVFFIGCSLSLCGFPFLAGFYSKDLIIEISFMSPLNHLILLILFFGTIMTATYSIRLIYYIFIKNIGLSIDFKHSGEELVMVNPIRVLFIVSIIIGAGFNWLFLNCFIVLLPLFLKTLILISLLIFSLTILIIINKIVTFNKSRIGYLLTNYLGTIWNLPILSTAIMMPNLSVGFKYLKYLDIGWLEYYGGQGFNLVLSKGSSISDYWRLLGIKSYLLMIFFIVFIIIFV